MILHCKLLAVTKRSLKSSSSARFLQRERKYEACPGLLQLACCRLVKFTIVNPQCNIHFLSKARHVSMGDGSPHSLWPCPPAARQLKWFIAYDAIQ